MTATTGSIPTNPYWIATNIIAAALGISLTLLMDGRGSSLRSIEVPYPVGTIIHYMTHPAIYVVVAIFAALGAVQDRFTGWRSVLCSFMVGGTLTSIVLSLI